MLDGKRLHLRVVKHVEAGSHHLTVISNVPLTAQLLRIATSQLGSVTVFPPDEDTKPEPDTAPNPSTRRPKSSSALGKDKLNIDVGNSHATVKSVYGERRLKGGGRAGTAPAKTPSIFTFRSALPSPPSTGIRENH